MSKKPSTEKMINELNQLLTDYFKSKDETNADRFESCYKIAKDWMSKVDEARLEFYEYLNTNYEYCEGCKKYNHKEDFEYKTETMYYKDTPINYPEDMNQAHIGDKEVEISYRICKICGHKRPFKVVTTKYVYNGKEFNMKEEKDRC